MAITATITMQSWDDITDVRCPAPRCPGMLRWAEAGHVPGYRICDGSRHHHWELDTEHVLRYAGRCSPRPKASNHRIQAAREQCCLQMERESGERAAGKDIRVWGINISSYQPVDTATDRAYTDSYRETMASLAPALWAQAQHLSSLLPSCVSLLSLTHDGRALLYRVRGADGKFGGTWVVEAHNIRMIPDVPNAEAYFSEIGAHPGYIFTA